MSEKKQDTDCDVFEVHSYDAQGKHMITVMHDAQLALLRCKELMHTGHQDVRMLQFMYGHLVGPARSKQ